MAVSRYGVSCNGWFLPTHFFACSFALNSCRNYRIHPVSCPFRGYRYGSSPKTLPLLARLALFNKKRLRKPVEPLVGPALVKHHVVPAVPAAILGGGQSSTDLLVNKSGYIEPAPLRAPNGKPMAFAVVDIKDRQHKVTFDDAVMVNWMAEHDIGTKLVFDQVLLVGTRDYTLMGRPTVEGALVHATVEEHFQCGKVLSFKKKRRKRYKRLKGHRSWVTILRIDDLEWQAPSAQSQDSTAASQNATAPVEGASDAALTSSAVNAMAQAQAGSASTAHLA